MTLTVKDAVVAVVRLQRDAADFQKLLFREDDDAVVDELIAKAPASRRFAFRLFANDLTAKARAAKDVAAAVAVLGNKDLDPDHVRAMAIVHLRAALAALTGQAS